MQHVLPKTWALIDELDPPAPPRAWTSSVWLVRVLLFMAAAALSVKMLGLATTLAVALVFWALFWPE